MKKYLQVAAITLTIPFFALLIFKTHSVQAQAPAQTVETAGQHFKNIKVLNEMPADQLGKAMNLFSASLGVHCDFCHYGEDFEKDGKREKDTARQMLKMMFALNKDYFRGRPEVSCNSCHNGRERPQAVPTLGVAISEDEPSVQPTTKPSVDQIIDRYLMALGGTERLAKINSRYVKANRVEPDNKTVEPEEIWFKSGKYVATTRYDKYLVKEEFDGSAATKFSNSDPIQLKPDEAVQIRREAELFSPTNIRSIYPKMDYRFVDKINGRDAYIVIAAAADGLRERLAFDLQSGLLVRRTASTPTVVGNFVYQVDYLDYKDFGGVKIPTTVKYSVPNLSWTRRVLLVKTNTTVDDGLFNARASKN